jgi:DNA topoisomerase-1
MADLEIITDPKQSSREAGLRYVSDENPGITRKKHGKNFQYFDAAGKRITDEETLRRIRSLVIPPAWTDVWICPAANGHLQATGRDARKRKQYRYHPRWRAVRDETKYERMRLFGEALPKIRAQVESDLSLPGLPREKVLATIVRLLETTFIRVGNEEYARENHSFGLTTMHDNHVRIEGSKVHFHFKGKSGKVHSIDVNDRQLARIVKKCRDVPGYELFQYIDDEGNHRSVDASDVNEYLHAIAGEAFTAKDFRTWAGTVLACSLLRQFESCETQTQAKKNVVQAIASVAERLGNTPSVCRKCYVHPQVIESYMSGAMVKAFAEQVKKEVAKEPHALRGEELDVLYLLEEKAKLAA